MKNHTNRKFSLEHGADYWQTRTFGLYDGEYFEMTLPERLQPGCDFMVPACPHAAKTEVHYGFFVGLSNLNTDGELALEIFLENTLGQVGLCVWADFYVVRLGNKVLLL